MGKNVNGNESLGCISMRCLVDVPILECKFFAQHTPKLGGGGGGVRGHEPMLEMSYLLTLHSVVVNHILLHTCSLLKTNSHTATLEYSITYMSAI